MATQRQDLEAHRDNLYGRLENGYTKIEQALARGDDVCKLEDFWVALLKDYEAVCDRLQEDMTAEETMRQAELLTMPARRFE